MAEVLRQGIHRGTVALVTGGGTGIGRAVALDLARCGADIVICGRRPEPLEKAAAEIEALGTRALAVPADIRDDAAVRHLVDSALEWSGRIDTLVNNAGGQFTAPAEQITRKGWRAVHRLTVDAAWAVTREVVPAMIPQRSGAVLMAFSAPWHCLDGARQLAGPAGEPGGRSRMEPVRHPDLAPAPSRPWHGALRRGPRGRVIVASAPAPPSSSTAVPTHGATDIRHHHW